MKSFILGLTAIGFLFIIGCGDNKPTQDETKPYISSVNFLGGNEIQAGDSLNVRLTFQDNIALSEAFVEIHDNFEGHKHQKVNTKFASSAILLLEGESDAKTANFLVPANAASGPYHMNLSVIDLEGNQSDVKVLSFSILQDNQPKFKSMVAELSVSRGDQFNISFDVEDETDLKEISYVILDHDDELASSLFNGDIDLNGPDDLGFSFNQNFSISKLTSEAEFVVSVLDSDGNMSVAVIEIHVQ
ncbi:MAG: hypothetical protein ACI8SE_002226 [Bacteroidia bacterium]|jgi:hypothetical protein